MREMARTVLGGSAWAFGGIGYMKYLVMDAEQVLPIHFVVFGCWLFLAAASLRRSSSEGSNG